VKVVGAAQVDLDAEVLRLRKEGRTLREISACTGLMDHEIRRVMNKAELEERQNREPAPRVAPRVSPLIARPQSDTARIRCSELFVDPKYQRKLNERWILNAAMDFDPKLLGVLEVSARAEGRYAIVDGQHRWQLVMAADRRRREAMVLCHVHRNLTVEQEAELFDRFDQGRRSLTGWDRWKARRARGDEVVLRVEKIVRDAGLEMRPSYNKSDKGVVASHAACEDVVEMGGYSALERALVPLVGAWGKRERIEREVLTGVAMVRMVYPDDELTDEWLVEALSGITARQLKIKAQATREVYRTSVTRLVGHVVVELCNDCKGRRSRLEGFLLRVPVGSRSTTQAKRKPKQTKETP
jgi:hypothetical protein